jgi:hypothetical protein
MRCVILSLTAAMFVSHGLASTNDAQRLFERYVALSRNSDPSLTNLYSTNAVLRMVSGLSDSLQTNAIPFAVFRKVVEQPSDESKQRAGARLYSLTHMRESNQTVEITGLTWTKAAEQTNRFSLVTEGTGEDMRIAEETVFAEARPFLDQKRRVKPREEWNREVIVRKEGVLHFRVAADQPFSVTLLSDAAYRALRSGDQHELRQHKMLYSKDSTGPVQTGAIHVEPGAYHFIIRNNGRAASELHLQCYGQ